MIGAIAAAQARRRQRGPKPLIEPPGAPPATGRLGVAQPQARPRPNLDTRRGRREYLDEPGLTDAQRSTRISEVEQANEQRRRAFVAKHPTLTRFAPDVAQRRERSERLADVYARQGLEAPEGGFMGRSLAEGDIYAPVQELYRRRLDQDERARRASRRIRDAKAANVPLQRYKWENVTRWAESEDGDVELLGQPTMGDEPIVQDIGNGLVSIYDPKTDKTTIRQKQRDRALSPADPGGVKTDPEGNRWIQKGQAWDLHPEDDARIQQKYRTPSQGERTAEGRYTDALAQYKRDMVDWDDRVLADKRDAQADLEAKQAGLDAIGQKLAASEPDPVTGISKETLLESERAELLAKKAAAEVEVRRAQRRIEDIEKGRDKYKKPMRPNPETFGLPFERIHEPALGGEAAGDGQGGGAGEVPLEYEPERQLVSEADYGDEIADLVRQYEVDSVFDWLVSRLEEDGFEGDAEQKAMDIFLAKLGPTVFEPQQQGQQQGQP